MICSCISDLILTLIRAYFETGVCTGLGTIEVSWRGHFPQLGG